MQKLPYTRWGILALLIALVVLRGPETAHGQGASPPATSSIDVVVVLDDSGSMATCWPWAGPLRADDCLNSQNPPSDPHNLRYSAARLLLQLAGDDDRVAVIRFNAVTESVIDGLQSVGASANRQSLIGSVRPPSDYEQSGGYTRIDLGLEEARKILAAAAGPDRSRYVLFLTDGVPSQPGGVPRQDQAVQQTMARLQELGAQVYPVLLCNEKAGCPDATFIKQTMGRVPEEAKTAKDLLQVFSAVFAQMKPDLHVVDQRNANGELQLMTRPAHGAQQLIIVAERDSLRGLKRDGNPEAVSRAYSDDNILVNVVEANPLPEGTWTVETGGRYGFVVARTATYPELVFPPPSVPGSAAAPHFVPTGKPVAVVARIMGPGGAEPLLVDGTAPLKPLAPDTPLLWAVLPGTTERLTLQVGADKQPLQIQREFRIQARPDLPAALAQSPSPALPCLAATPCTLKAAFGPGPEIRETQGMVYVTDESDGGRLAYSGAMTCTGRECSDPAQGFKRLDGHTYTVRFLLQARSQDVQFGDWAETTLVMESAVYLSGLPPSLNLKEQPAAGWPVTITVGTTEDLGQLRATMVLTRTEDDTTVSDARVNFSAAISGAGRQQATLRVALPPELRPGHYAGQIRFAADKLSASRNVRLPDPLPVTLNLARPAVTVSGTAVDFGEVSFDTSPNFRLDQTALLALQFNETQFNVTPLIEDSSCPGLTLVAGKPEAQGERQQVALRLRSAGPITPQTCTGTFTLQGPSEDYEVQPGTPISWRVLIPEVEWELVGVERDGAQAKDIAAGNIGRPGERSKAVLLVHYTGHPPFSLEVAGLRGEADRSSMTIGDQDVELVQGVITPQPGMVEVYRVPVELVVRRSLPHVTQAANWLFGTDYSGRLQLGIGGLPDRSVREVGFRIHSPSQYQRYVAPLYSWWWPGVLTCPLSILIPLVLFAFLWIRKKDADVERIMKESRQQEPLGHSSVGQPGREPPGSVPRLIPEGQLPSAQPTPGLTGAHQNSASSAGPAQARRLVPARRSQAAGSGGRDGASTPDPAARGKGASGPPGRSSGHSSASPPPPPRSFRQRRPK